MGISLRESSLARTQPASLVLARVSDPNGDKMMTWSRVSKRNRETSSRRRRSRSVRTILLIIRYRLQAACFCHRACPDLALGLLDDPSRSALAAFRFLYQSQCAISPDALRSTVRARSSLVKVLGPAPL